MAQRSSRRQGSLVSEFASVVLGDARLEKRALRIIERIEAAPGDSFPEQMRTVAEREALYRFLSNEAVNIDALLAGHVQQTHLRMQRCDVVRIVSDTSDFAFEGDREGLGIVRGATKGFFAHVALAVSGDDLREPLGVLGVRAYARTETERRRGMSRAKRVAETAATPRDAKESSRWEKLALQVSAALPAGVRAVYVMDQEADDFAAIAAMDAAGLRFVVRGAATRRTGVDTLVSDALAAAPTHPLRTAFVNRRVAKAASPSRRARDERHAELHVKWAPITLPRFLAQSDVAEVRLNVVHVFEPSPPPGVDAIAWTLFTSEPVASTADAAAVVDHYRARWVIEELFKALKTGCSFEKRQLTTLDGLLRALGLFLPTAWKLLAMRTIGRIDDRRPARTLFDVEQLLLLHALLAERRYVLPKAPSVRDVMLGIAALGGHIKNNGDPGWLVLGRGFMKFLDAEVGWRAARRSDQS